MHIVYLIGRIAFVSIFLASGIFKLLDIAGTAAILEVITFVPQQLEPYAANVTAYTGMTTFQLLAIVLSVVEIVFALFIIFNVATRFSAIVLAVFLAVGTYFAHDFWNMTGDVKATNLDAFIRNVAILGGLLMMIAIGPWRPGYGGEDYAASE